MSASDKMEGAGQTKWPFAIAAILMAVIVVGSAVLYVWASSFLTESKTTPIITTELEERPDGFLIIITQVDVQVPYSAWRWRLVDAEGAILQEGNLMHAWQLNLAYRDTNGTPAGLVSVHDVINNGRMSPGDQIYFSEELFPASIDGVRLELVFHPTNETRASLPLAAAAWNPSPFPTWTAPITTIERDVNLSFGPGEPLSRNSVLIRGWRTLDWEITLRIVNTGNDSYQNVTFHIDSGHNANEENIILDFPEKTTTTFTKQLTYSPGVGSEEWVLRFMDDNDVMILVGKITVTGVRSITFSPSFSLTLPFLFLALLSSALAQQVPRFRRRETYGFFTRPTSRPSE